MVALGDDAHYIRKCKRILSLICINLRANKKATKILRPIFFYNLLLTWQNIFIMLLFFIYLNRLLLLTKFYHPSVQFFTWLSQRTETVVAHAIFKDQRIQKISTNIILVLIFTLFRLIILFRVKINRLHNLLISTLNKIIYIKKC